MTELSPPLTLHLVDEVATDALAQRLVQLVRSGDVLLLSGPIGAGKSHFARTMIQTLQSNAGGEVEDVPSPTYTLVQVYQAGAMTIWHADLYRLGDTSELEELGLTEAIGNALCLIEWPDRMGPMTPDGGLMIELAPVDDGAGRTAKLSSSSEGWTDRLCTLQRMQAA